MPTPDELVLRILSEAPEPLYSSDIAARLNRELQLWRAYSPVDVVKLMQVMGNEVVQLSDGRWTLKRRAD